MLNSKDLRELISVTKQHINLPDAVIEKDYYVTQVIHALSNIEDEYFRLVFAGGTCLAKGHKIVKRMSEDVDFKIQIKKREEGFSKTRFLKELKQFRSLIPSKLEIPDALAKEIIDHDTKQFKNQHPEYSVDPGAEIKRSLTLLKNKPQWKERYQEFIETMVYDNTFALEYERVIGILEELSERVVDSLSLETT